jgi:acetoacetate decarboxylase
MPLTSPAYPPGPYRFVNREYLIITYCTHSEKLRPLVPEPLVPDGGIVKIRVHPHTGFDRLRRLHRDRPSHPGYVRRPQGGYSHSMFLNDGPLISGGRELWGFPKKLADPTLHVDIDTLVKSGALPC